MSRFRVTLEGRSYDVTVEEYPSSKKPPRPLVPTAAFPMETAAMSLGPPPNIVRAAPKGDDKAGTDSGAVLCPLAGKLVTIDVPLGATVVAGTQVATVAAMKMNTCVFAPVAGKVASIFARPGDLVEEGAILLHIASPEQRP